MRRLSALSSQKLYRPETGKADAYANLQLILSRPIDWDLVRQQYDQMIKYATALRLGTAETEAILRRFTKQNVQHPTYKALAELGKAIKLILLAMTHPAAVGAAFHSIDEGSQNWHDYFVALCRALDLRMPRWSVPRPVAYPVAALLEIYGKARGYASRPLVTRTAVEIIGTRQGFSTARARQRLGFSPTIGFEEGVGKTAAWLRAQQAGGGASQDQ